MLFGQASSANAVESDILAKYESLGGPVGSDLGLPTANEGDGGIASARRIAMFSAADKPVIFWTTRSRHVCRAWSDESDVGQTQRPCRQTRHTSRKSSGGR